MSVVVFLNKWNNCMKLDEYNVLVWLFQGRGQNLLEKKCHTFIVYA